MTGTKVLLVDDDEDVRAALGTALGMEGFVVTTAGDHDTGLAAFETSAPDVALLDVRLPGPSGFELCRALRRRSQLPVLMISGLGGEGDIVTALEAGADDYLVKPFGLAELVARIRAALRRVGPRGQSDPTETLRFGDLVLHVAGGRAWLREQLLELSATDFALVHTLVSHAGRTVTRAQLVADGWGFENGASKKTVDARVRRLRAKLGPAARIVTVRGVGFRIEPGDGVGA